MHDPEFNPALRPPSALSRLLDWRRYVPESWYAKPTTDSGRRELTKEEREAIERDTVIDDFIGKLEVLQQGSSVVVTIGVTTRDPSTSQLVTNTLTDFYIVSQLDAKLEATERASNWLVDRMDQLRVDAEVSAKAVEAYREERGLLQADSSGTLAEQEISALNLRYVDQQSELTEIRARLRQAEILLNNSATTATAPEVLNSPSSSACGNGKRNSSTLSRK